MPRNCNTREDTPSRVADGDLYGCVEIMSKKRSSRTSILGPGNAVVWIFVRNTKLETLTRVKHSTCMYRKKRVYNTYIRIYVYIFLLFFNVYGFCGFRRNFLLMFAGSSSAVAPDHTHTCAALNHTIRTFYKAIYFTLKKRILSVNLFALWRSSFISVFQNNHVQNVLSFFSFFILTV